ASGDPPARDRSLPSALGESSPMSVHRGSHNAIYRGHRLDKPKTYLLCVSSTLAPSSSVNPCGESTTIASPFSPPPAAPETVTLDSASLASSLSLVSLATTLLAASFW